MTDPPSRPHPTTLAVDAMGGDLGPAAVVPAVVELLGERSEVEVLLCGRPEALEPLLPRNEALRARIRIEPAQEVVAMDDPPSRAFRSKKDSSMRRAVAAVAEGRAAACLSSGNTGALMALAYMILKTLPGIDRPAICAPIPAHGRPTLMLDLGANLEANDEHLVQFALMGATLARAVYGIEEPTVGLLNVGSEENKGHETLRRAHRRLAASVPGYRGYVEGHDIHAGVVDVIVTDGFTGNVALKTAEGLALYIAGILREEFTASPLSRLQAAAASGVLGRVRRRLDPGRYNGASLLGLRGIVVKSHGRSDAGAVRRALDRTLQEVAFDVPGQLARRLAVPSPEASAL